MGEERRVQVIECRSVLSVPKEQLLESGLDLMAQVVFLEGPVLRGDNDQNVHIEGQIKFPCSCPRKNTEEETILFSASHSLLGLAREFNEQSTLEEIQNGLVELTLRAHCPKRFTPHCPENECETTT